jgi:hypothetical protein
MTYILYRLIQIPQYVPIDRLIILSNNHRMLLTDGSARELPSDLSKAYKLRFPSILDKSRNWQQADFTKYTSSLDRQEQICINRLNLIILSFLLTLFFFSLEFILYSPF